MIRNRVELIVDSFENGDIQVTFDEKGSFKSISTSIANAYCPICDQDRWIPNYKGYCVVCGHHLNQMEGHHV